MQKIIFSFISLLIAPIAFSQADSAIAPPYKRFPDIPPFRLLTPDSSSVFTKTDLKKNRPVLIILFSPECEHCRRETEDIVKHIDDFEKIQIVMATTMPFDKMKQFYTDYQLARHKNITVGRDIQYLLPVYYDIRNLPFLAFYDRKGKLIEAFEGSLPVEKMLTRFE